ncbi:ligase-associated DNA damage response endonuclease PdeM [Parvularcula sp. ZS-1/3]|uniref:Ligase-associated DNA damage response endonuclease PdeM n=1 Tax=Parvularcula mediterranea TaxID=2732508 RepID=A0A7Y3W500_9PROT|nr:ligase-associated DNA damage response endonuclease PdeM [Parvularcula mediterranea]NNU16013.1 ligase-associated DNA damage response endonuclease PdeM [Parvularcula mediterranea]
MQTAARLSETCLPGTVILAGREVVLDCSGAMLIPDEGVLVVSDLHFEKGSHFAQKGQFLPPYDTRATLDGVERLMRLCRPKTVVSLGDAFHDTDAEARMDEADAERLSRLCEAADWVWVLGNHDPLPPKRFRGTATEIAQVAGLTFSHEPGDHEGWQVAGHLHPCAVAQKDGRGVRRPAFVTDGAHMVMPAFGAFTGGLNVLDEAFAPVFPDGFQAHLCGKSRVYAVPRKSLRGDAPPAHWMR